MIDKNKYEIILAVTGGRKLQLTDIGSEELMYYITKFFFTKPILLIHGDAKGIDTSCNKVFKALKKTAEEFDWLVNIEPFPANWDRYQLRAGFIRNRVMAELATHCVVFKGNKGTMHMYGQCQQENVKIIDWRNKFEYVELIQ